ncbi:MAG TPA: histidine kinase [Vicinamibacteria bacterium]|nr:histidine kinase [Vicinamibacteria bacterium]
MSLLRRDVGPYLRMAAWGVGLWVVYDSVFIAQSVLWHLEKGMRVPWGRLTANYLDSVFFGLGAPVAVWISTRWPFARDAWPRAAAAHLAAGTLIHLGYIATVQPIRPYYAVFFDDPNIARPTTWILFVQTYLGALLMYVQMAFVSHGVLYYRRWRERELRASRLETQLAQAQLQMLRMQLHPHFLFNTLHSVSALMHTDVKAADHILALLGDLLRDSLDKVGAQEVTLKQELDFIDRYLEIERTRFRDRLSVKTLVDPEAWDVQVPNLILQPLVENAIRHGISRRAGTGHLVITAARVGSRLVLGVSDDGPGLPAEGLVRGRGGVGLANTQARLHQLYGGEASFELRSRADGRGVEARVEIPVRAATAGLQAPVVH